jgi:DNA repair protein RadC
MLSSPQARPCGEAPRSAEPLATPELATLGDRDLLAIMLSWVRAEQPDALATDLLERFGSLAQVLVAAPDEILAVNGAGVQVVVLARCAREAGMRLCRDQIDRRPVISSWSQLVDYVRACIAHLPREQFRALYLDRRNILLREELVAEGTVDHAPVYPREVIRRALELSASAVILVHNHPSGDPTPSAADIEMTRRVVDAARVFGLQVHDHLVVGREGTASFRALGLI